MPAMLLKKAFSSGGPGLFAPSDSPAPSVVPSSGGSSSSAVSAAPAPPSSSSWRDFDWLRRGTSAITRRGRSSVTPMPPQRSSATPSVSSSAPRHRLTVPAGPGPGSATAAGPSPSPLSSQQRAAAPAAAAVAASPTISSRASLASQSSSRGAPLPPHSESRHHQSLRPSEADDDDDVSTPPSTQSARSAHRARAVHSAWSSSTRSPHSSVRSSLNASRAAARASPALELPVPTPLAPRGGKQRHTNTSSPSVVDVLSSMGSPNGSTTSSKPRARAISTRAARSQAARPSTAPKFDDTTPRGSLDLDASPPESRHTSLAASSSAHTSSHASSRPTSSMDRRTESSHTGVDAGSRHAHNLPTPSQKTNNVRTRARARGSLPLTSVSMNDKAAASTSATTGDSQGIITRPLFGRSQHSLSTNPARSSVPSDVLASDDEDAISKVSKRLSRQLTQSGPTLNTADTSAAGDTTLKPFGSQHDDAVERDHTLSTQSSASTLALRPRAGAVPLSTLQALAPSSAQTGSNFASRFKAAHEQSNGLTPTSSRSGGQSLTEKSSVATLTSSSMHKSSSNDPLKAMPSTPRAAPYNSPTTPVATDGRLKASGSHRSLSDDDGVRTMGLAVVGQHSVGKTSVIRRGLRQYGLSRPTVISSMIRAYAIRCVLDQSAAENIRVLELDSAAFVAPTGTELAWPDELADPERPGHGKIEGAVICYDAGYLPSLKGVPELLEFFHKTHIPTVVLACKSDNPAKAIDPFLVRELASKFGARVTECSVAPPPAGAPSIGEENKRRLRGAFHHLLRSMAQDRVQRADLELGYATATILHRHHHGSNRPSSKAQSNGKGKGKGAEKGARKTPYHAASRLFSSSGQRVNPEDLPLEERERMQEEEQAAGPGPEALSISEFLASMDLTTPSFSSSDSESEDEGGVRIEPAPDADTDGAESEDESHSSAWSTSSHRVSMVSTSSNPDDEADPDNMLRDVSIPSMPSQIGGASAPTHSTSTDGRTKDISSSVAASGTYDSHFPLAMGRKKARAKEPVYVPLADLLERFFQSIVNSSDPEFLSAVLVFYRAFATPELMLSEFMARYDALIGGGSQDAGNAKFGNQQGLIRLVTVFHDWVRQYPGDLSTPEAIATVAGFLDEVSQNPTTAELAARIEPDVELCQSTIDLDVMWSVDACAPLLSNPEAWTEMGVSESAAARHDAYSHSVLLSTSQPMKQDPSTESAKRALEALSPTGLSMLSPSLDGPQSAPDKETSPAATSVAVSEPTGMRDSAPSTALPSNGTVPSADVMNLAEALKVTPAEAESRMRSASVQTGSSGQASVQGWRQGSTTASDQHTVPSARTASNVAKADKTDGLLSEPKTSTRPAGLGGHPRSNTISSVSTTGQTSISAASVSSTASSTVPSSLGSGPAGSELPTAKRAMTLRAVSNALLVVDEAALAEEMTRLEWALFSVIGPRDWLRHTLVKTRHRVPHGRVAQSINHFNYTSAWVVSVVLAQPKIKARVRVMEKMIRLAVRLRVLNNYNTLYAVLAGLASSPIHRLKNTRAVVQENKELHKRYLSLHSLMRPDRASSAYRLALENSSGRIIPFIGVHLHDILSSAEGNPSRRQADGAVHWRKFALMDDAISTLTKAQRADSSPPVKHPDLTPLFMDVPTLEEDAAYDMSLVLEPKTTTSTAHNFLRKMQGS